MNVAKMRFFMAVSSMPLSADAMAYWYSQPRNERRYVRHGGGGTGTGSGRTQQLPGRTDVLTPVWLGTVCHSPLVPRCNVTCKVPLPRLGHTTVKPGGPYVHAPPAEDRRSQALTRPKRRRVRVDAAGLPPSH